jgi:hypothetical protein
MNSFREAPFSNHFIGSRVSIYDEVEEAEFSVEIFEGLKLRHANQRLLFVTASLTSYLLYCPLLRITS